ncbi:MAG: OmpA family protein [Flavobacteriales bacterium]|nr:OmpA family protein [Flavobacteriales bacterium]
MKRVKKVTLLDTNINTPYSDHTPVVNSDESFMMFVSRDDNLDEEKKRNKRLDAFERLYTAKGYKGKFEKARPYEVNQKFLRKNINGWKSAKEKKIHHAPVWLSVDNKDLIFYYKNHLWSAALKNDTIQSSEKFSKTINRDRYQPHGSMTKDQKNFYFVSSVSDNTLKGENLDIFRARKTENGEWADAERLGKNINTELDENSPIISPDGNKLFFSSKGHNGIGAYDVFVSTLIEGQWTLPVNLGSPVNSEKDDVFFNPTVSEHRTYFSSNREGGYGAMDIYRYDYYDILENCKSIEDQYYQVTFDASESIDTEGANLIFEWEFGDGNRKQGISIKHKYRRPGTFNVSLNILDSISGVKYENEKTFEILIDSVNYVNMNVPDTVFKGVSSELSISDMQFKEGEIDHFIWMLGDTIFRAGDSIKYCFEKEGNVEVIVQMSPKQKLNDASLYYCISKNVTVVDSLKYPNKIIGNKLAWVEKNVGDLLVNNSIENKRGYDLKKEGRLVIQNKFKGSQAQDVEKNATDLLSVPRINDSIVNNLSFDSEGSDSVMKAAEHLINNSLDVTQNELEGNRTNSNLDQKSSLLQSDGEQMNESTIDTIVGQSKVFMNLIHSELEEVDLGQNGKRNEKENDLANNGGDGKQEKIDKTVLSSSKLITDSSLELMEKETVNELRDGDLTSLKNNGNLILLPSIYFDFDRSSLNNDALSTLQENIKVLQENSSYRIIIEGHADSRGLDEYNKMLSGKRAETVEKIYLKYGVSKSRIIRTDFLGESILTNDCGDKRSCSSIMHKANRRVETKIIVDEVK